MRDDGTIKDDVKLPVGEIGDKIKGFAKDSKDASMCTLTSLEPILWWLITG